MPGVDRLPTKLPDYFPPAAGRYEVKPGLVRFGRDLGGGEADEHIFQIDATFPRYRAGKLAARAERLGKYFQTHQLDPPVERSIAIFIVGRLVKEHPDLFALAGGTLSCELTGERLPIDAVLREGEAPAEPDTAGDSRLGRSLALPGRSLALPCRVVSDSAVQPPYVSALDALAMQVQEDLAIVSTAGDRHWLSAVHLSFPNHWAAEDKIGRTFPVIHQPVAGMEQMNRQSDKIVRIMIEATEGLVRFAWGITWDDELNHHPQSPPGMARARGFDPLHPAAFLRVERQTVWGFPDVGAALFTIRTYLYDLAEVREDSVRRASLAAAIRSMSAESLLYKGLAGSRDALLAWIEKDETT